MFVTEEGIEVGMGLDQTWRPFCSGCALVDSLGFRKAEIGPL